MSAKLWDLRKIVNLEKWENLQDSLAEITKMAIITVDYKGVPVTKHSLCNEFCREIRKDSEMFQCCKKCDARGGLEAVRQNKPYIYYCHCNIIDLAVPIRVDDKYLGAFMAGQVRLADGEGGELEKIVTISAPAYDKKKADIMHLYEKLPVLTLAEVELIAEMLSRLANYIIEEAIHKNMLLSLQASWAENHDEAPKMILSASAAAGAVLGERLKSAGDQLPLCKNATLRPIFRYLHEHRGETVSLKQAALLCHISPSHFSRLFTKETGENYSTFITHLKINWSKQLLTETDMSIAQMSEELGYNEAGYFIKTFKKFEGVTPLHYRKHYAVRRGTADRDKFFCGNFS